MLAVAHNLVSQFTSRQLNVTTTEKRKSSEKLSSGYRINRSADDAAGLQISEKMRSQIRGLNQASRNIQDAISLCQVADGALNESHSILQRMRELSVQAANDTNQAIDRDAIQSEINELTKEVDRIANDTSFNQEIYPLNSSSINDSSSIFEYSFRVSEYTRIVHASRTDGIIINGVKYNSGEQVSMTGLTLDTDHMMYSSTGRAQDKNIGDYIGGIWDDLKISDLKVDEDGYVYVDGKQYVTDGNGNILYSYDKRLYPAKVTYWVNPIERLHLCVDKNYSVDQVISSIEYLKSNKDIGLSSKGNGKLWIQTGANSGQGMFLSLVNATAKGVGITDPALDVTSHDNAGTSISRLDNAINKVSSYRSHFGAQQNRLEHAKAADDNTAENTQYAESRIRDTDIAEEMVRYSKHSILEQVGTSMLAQANQSTRGILSLLQ